ncbi:TPA: hypothetical protein ACH3X2_001915 [Trebouxia sp. C0005]
MGSPDGHQVTGNQSFKVPQGSAASLFPAYAGAGGPHAAGWLQNTSFPAMPAQPKAAPGTEEQEARRLRLKQAAEQLLPSSSSDSESEGGADQVSGEFPASARQKAQVADSDGSSDESSHRKHKRRREHSKQKKHKKNRHEKKKQKVEPAAPQRRKTDEEKIIELERKAAEQGQAVRGAHVSSWANADVAPEDMYFLDSRGDRNNLVYHALYRADIAAYHRTDPGGLARGATQHHGRHNQRFNDPETDAAAQKAGGFSAPRYFGARQARAERDRSLKRLRLGHALEVPQGRAEQDKALKKLRLGHALEGAQGFQEKGPAKLSLPLPVFIPLEPASKQPQHAWASDEEEEGAPGESQDEYILRRTKEFNIAVRERSHDLQLWLDYAAFQDETTRSGRGRRGVQAGIAEKKISILERALEFHPGSDRLLLALLDAAQAMSTPEELQRRWQVVLSYHGGSAKLWREHLQWQRAQYASFAVPQLRESYQNAVQALKQERVRRAREGAPASILAETEDALIGFFTEGCRFEMQAGHMERAVASIQAALENTCFAPSIPVGGEGAKAGAFRDFWEAGAPLVGDEGATGWATWESKQGMGLHSPAPNGTPAGGTATTPRQENEEKGGWGEWVPLMPDTPMEPKAAPESEADAEAAADEATDEAKEEQEEGELVEVLPEPTDEELLAQLGLELEQQMADLTASDELPAGIMQQWAEEELCRDRVQWQPRRELPNQAMDEKEDRSDDAGEVLEFRDIKGSMPGPLSEQAQLGLVCQCLELLGAPLGGWQSSNATSHQDANNSRDSLTGSLAQLLLQPGWLMQGSSSSLHLDPKLTWLAPGAPPNCKDPGPILTATQPWFQRHPSRQAFLSRTLALLLSGPFLSHQPFCEALLAVEASHVTPDADTAPAQQAGDGESFGQMNVNRAREAAKKLLAEQRGNLGMWAAYASLESRAGQYKAARKVYDTALSSLPSMQTSSSQQHAASLALAYAESELSRGGIEAPMRALHVLAWLGSGGPFTPFKSPSKGGAATAAFSPDMILQARRGFQTQLSQTLSSAATSFDATSAAVVSAAALFEELLPALAASNGPVRALLGQGSGPSAAVALYQHAIDAVPTEAQRFNAALEGLRVKQCGMLLAYTACRHPAVTPGHTRQALIKALGVYPESARLLGMLAECEQRGHTMSRLRLHLTGLCHGTPAALLWLMAIKAEATVPAASHRVQALFEQAIADKTSQHFPLLWRCYMSYEICRGRHEAARRVLLRAVHTCPGAKALWLDGLHFLAEQMPGTERKDLLQLMTAKGLHVRTDTYEILLKSAADAASLPS